MYFSDMDNASLNDVRLIINDSHRQTRNVIIPTYEKAASIILDDFRVFQTKVSAPNPYVIYTRCFSINRLP